MAIHNTYDHALKTLARHYPESFLTLSLPNLPVRLVGTQENLELALEIDRVDFLHEIIIKGDRAYLHFDFELKHSSAFPRRIHVYNGMLTELKKPMAVISIPIYLKPRDKKVPNVYEVKVGGYVFHRFTYQPIQLWEHMDDIRSGKLYPLAPLLVLLTKNPTEETLAQEREIIKKHEPNPERRRTLFTTAILTALAQNIFDSDFLWNFFKEPNMLLTDDPFLNRLFKERYGPKLAEEVAEVEAKAQAEMAEMEAKARAEVAEARQHVRQMEVALREAQAAQQEATAKAEMARREAQIKAEAEAKAEIARREAQIKAEVARREAQIKAEAQAKAKAEAAQRDVEAARREAEIKAQAEAKAKAKEQWLDTMSKFLTHRFANTPIEMIQDLQRISPRQHNEVINLALDVPDLATFRQELKGMVSAKE